MIMKFFIIVVGFFIGVVAGYLFIFYTSFSLKNENPVSYLENQFSEKQVIGFLPYWLLSKAKADYSDYINTLTYFGLIIDTDGTILKMQNPQENEPGWYALESGKVDPFINNAIKKEQKLSLLLFNADEASISSLMEDPVVHARNLIKDIKPIMQKYKFTDLNIDIESVKNASDEERYSFAQFIEELKKGIDENELGTLSIDISGDSLVKKRLINLPVVAPNVDYIIIMAYDYHYTGSWIAGPVAPLFGAGINSEYDTQAAVEKALEIVPSEKLILGIPLYGYEWETLSDSIRSATLPSSGLTASTQRVSQLLADCATCSAQTDDEAKESYLIYKDTATNTYHQIFYPDEKSTLAKIEFAKKARLGGVAFWALGYEDDMILNPLKSYK